MGLIALTLPEIVVFGYAFILPVCILKTCIDRGTTARDNR